MQFTDVVKKRRMVRNFSDQPVDAAMINQMLDLARRGPSAGYTQGQSFVVVSDPEVKKAVAQICGEQYYVEEKYHPFISKAPVLIVPCTSEAAYHSRYQEKDKVSDDGSEIDWPIPFWYMDIGCAVMTLL